MTRGSKTKACRCEAYPYPHREGGGKCLYDGWGVRKDAVYPGPDEMDLARDEAIRKQEEKDDKDRGNSG